jgi:hypothetical protein
MPTAFVFFSLWFRLHIECDPVAFFYFPLSAPISAIVKGLKGSIVDFSNGVDGISAKDVMDLLLVTQYFDTLKEIGNGRGSKTLFLQHGPSAVSDLQASLRDGLMVNMAMKR